MKSVVTKFCGPYTTSVDWKELRVELVVQAIAILRLSIFLPGIDEILNSTELIVAPPAKPTAVRSLAKYKD